MSYDASTTLKSRKKGNIQVVLWAGSYNPGNQPEYGSDWEYYHVDVDREVKGQSWFDTIEKDEFYTKKEAMEYYKRMVSKYITKKQTSKMSHEEGWKKDIWNVKK